MEFIFITLLLIILLVVSRIFSAKKAYIPLICIYALFTIVELSSWFGNSNSFEEEIIPKNLVIKQSSQNKNKEIDTLNQNQKDKKNKNLNNSLNSGIKINNINQQKLDKSLTKKEVSTPSEKKEILKPKKETKKAVQKKEVPKKIKPENILILKDIKICKGISNRKPLGVGTVFPNTVDSLYCHTKIENSGSKKEAKHIWYFENQIMTQVRYNVKKSKSYRSWTKKTILPYQVGNWRVDVQDQNGTIIGSKSFRIKKQ